MKLLVRPPLTRCLRLASVTLCVGVLSSHSLLAGDTNQPAPAAPSTPAADDTVYNNWINTTFGGLIIDGNKAQFQQANPTKGPVYGGIEDMHYQQDLPNKVIFTIDGHALFDNNDYKVILELSKADVGYIKAGYTGFTTYSDGNGAYLPATASLRNSMPGGLFYGGPEYALYRSSLWAELGLRIPTLPELTLRYEHDIRNGQEDSTSYGGVNTGMTPVPSGNSATRKILPSFWNINETQDVFTFKGKQLFGKPDAFGNTEVNLNLRYEFDNTSDSLNWQNRTTPLVSGPAPTAVANNKNNIPLVPSNYYVTQLEQNKLNNYNGNITSVTRFGDNLMFTAGYMYSAETSHIGGNQVAGPINGFSYTPYYNNIAYANRPSGAYIDLGGGSTVGQNVGSVNLLWTPIDGLTISPSMRYEFNDTQSASAYLTEVSQTNGTVITTNAVTKIKTTNAIVKSPAGVASSATLDNSSVLLNDFTESLQMRYVKVQDWVFYAQADWDQQLENRADSTPPQSYGYTPASGYNLSANNTYMTQKYQIGANWYPLARLNASAQYYWQTQTIAQIINADAGPANGTPRLANQNWNTQDANLRVTWQPFASVSMVTRYDLQQTTVNSQWQYDGNAATSFGAPYGPSSLIRNNMLTENVTWSPVDRLYLQGGLSYVLSAISSPAASQTPALQNANNNYWTANAGAGYQIDAKTELRGDFNFYSANNYQNNAQYGVPYSAGASDYSFSASFKRQITRNINWSLKYSFDTYRDQLSGGNNNYTAQMISTGLQMRF